MTTREDAKVAEIVEAMPEVPNEAALLELHRRYLRKEKLYSFGNAWNIEFEYVSMSSGKYGRGKPIWKPRLFLTAPTFESDGIVLEWVQDGQSPEFVEAFTEKLLEAIWGGIPQHEVREQLYEFTRFYQPGDYAKALLEVYNE